MPINPELGRPEHDEYRWVSHAAAQKLLPERLQPVLAWASSRTDSRFYGGSDLGNPLQLHADDIPWMGQPHSVVVTLPPLAGIVLASR